MRNLGTTEANALAIIPYLSGTRGALFPAEVLGVGFQDESCAFAKEVSRDGDGFGDVIQDFAIECSSISAR